MKFPFHPEQMSGLSLACGDCGLLLKNTKEAQDHAELTSHSNFVESTEAVNILRILFFN